VTAVRLTDSLTGSLTGSLTPAAARRWNTEPMTSRTQQRDAHRLQILRHGIVRAPVAVRGELTCPAWASRWRTSCAVRIAIEAHQVEFTTWVEPGA